MSATNLQMVERLLDQLTAEEQLTLIEQLAMRLWQATRAKEPKNLYGIWRDRFPVEFDIDSALKEVRKPTP